MGIRSYGVGITTLEEVFLRIGKGSEEDDPEEKQEMRRFTLSKKEGLQATNDLVDSTIQRDSEYGSG